MIPDNQLRRHCFLTDARTAQNEFLRPLASATMESLLDRYNAQPHQAPLTAAAIDQASGARVTADAQGTVAIIRPGDHYPSHVFDMGAPVRGAVAVSRGGALVAIGDEQGTLTVIKTLDGSCVFEDSKESAGSQRAMRALDFNPGGTVLASLAADGVLRIHDLQTWERLGNYRTYGGESIQFDRTGERLLVIDGLGQPKLLDLRTREMLDLELVPGGVRTARFVDDCRAVLCLGQGGITLIALPEGRIETSFSARGSSGMLSLVISPDQAEVGAVTGRSVHIFSLPELQPVRSERHGAETPTSAAWWDHRGVAVGGQDGLFHRPQARPSLEPVSCVSGFGEHRVVVHGDRIALWRGDRQRRPFDAGVRLTEVRVDRDGRLVLGRVGGRDGTGLLIFDARTGKRLFDAGADTVETTRFEVGGSIVAVAPRTGGVRWYDLKTNKIFQLDWARTFALSGSGTWLAVVTPKGVVRVLDPTTGEDAIPAPQPLAATPVAQVSFVNRRPDMLVLDEDGVLGHYDLTAGVSERRHVRGRDVLELKVPVDRLWGITGGQLASVRIPVRETQTATVLVIDLARSEVVAEVTDQPSEVWVDPESGDLLVPGHGAALLELDWRGAEKRVLRALPEGEWIAIGPRGPLDASDGAVR